MSWLRLGLNTRAKWNFNLFPPQDHWGQVDVWVPPQVGNVSCTGANEGFTPYFMYVSAVQDGLAAQQFNTPTFAWTTIQGAGSPGPPNLVPEAVITVGYHVYPATGGYTMDWYANGTLLVHSPGLSNAFGNQPVFQYLGYCSFLCCCNVTYYTNFKIGTSQGAGDVFSDDFSGGITDDWTIDSVYNIAPNLASVVGAPDYLPIDCPTVTISSGTALPGDTLTVTGSGFTPDSPLTMFAATEAGKAPVEEFDIASDGAGSFSTTIKFPAGLGSNISGLIFTFFVYDENNVLGCATVKGCGNRSADGITAGFDPVEFENTNLPDPVVGLGGTAASGSNQQYIFDYIYFDGAHWVLWQDPSVFDNKGTFPPPPGNHPLTATRIDPDGTATDYPIDSNYQWIFGGGNFNDPGLFNSGPCVGEFPGGDSGQPIWTEVVYFSSWDKPILDTHFCTDGSTLWVGLVTRETIIYPWLDNLDASTDPNGYVYAGAAESFLEIGVWTSGFTSFPTDTSTGRTIPHAETDGPINQYQHRAFPVTDAGEKNTGYWSPPCVAIYAFDGAAFNRIGTIPALYASGQTEGISQSLAGLLGEPQLRQAGQRGVLFGRVAMAANENDPGVLHVVWSEGGAWGRCGLAGINCTRLTWDGGPTNQSYRVNYTTWSPTAKLTDTDLWESHLDRTNWYFTWNGDNPPNEYPTGYTWPEQEDFAALLCYELRNDNENGDVLLFAGIPTSRNSFTEDQYGNLSPDGFGGVYLDRLLCYADTLHVWDITGGTPVLKQSLDTGLFPNEIECDTSYPPLNYGTIPKASNLAFLGPHQFSQDNSTLQHTFGPQDPGFALSEIWDDPTLDGTPVYQVQVQTARIGDPSLVPLGDNDARFLMRPIYRVPADMSDTFDFMDGERAYGYTVIGTPVSQDVGRDDFGSGRWFRDENNIYMPAPLGPRQYENGYYGLWFDKVCFNGWRRFPDLETPGSYDFGNVPPPANVGLANCSGYHYDPAADSISVCAPIKPYAFGPEIFTVTTVFLCRGCRRCTCGLGVHIAHRI